jgi:hypothetical protein
MTSEFNNLLDQRTERMDLGAMAFHQHRRKAIGRFYREDNKRWTTSRCVKKKR